MNPLATQGMSDFARELRARLGNDAPPAAVLFDLDGTLIRTRDLYLEAYRRALVPFLGRALSDAEILALEPRSEIRLFQSQVGAAALADCFEHFYRHYEALHPTLFGGIYDGVPELLQRLRAAGRPLGIVTGKSRRAWEITTAHAPLGPFDALVMDDDVPAPKPDPSGIRLALQSLRVPPEHAIYAGDSITDILAAVDAGVVPVAVLWSRRDPDRRTAFVERAAALGALIAETPDDLARACA